MARDGGGAKGRRVRGRDWGSAWGRRAEKEKEVEDEGKEGEGNKREREERSRRGLHGEGHQEE
eukprot:3418459-Pleurochrysis_carterae.AAC.1